MRKLYKYYTLLIFMFVLIFVLGIIVGMISECKINTLGFNQNKEILDIWINNLTVGISMFFIGSITGGIYSTIVIFLNGYLIGNLINFLINNKIVGTVISGLLPHALIEILGLACFATASIIPTFELLNWIRLNKEMQIRKKIKNLLCLLVVGGVILFIAAYIECEVSFV